MYCMLRKYRINPGSGFFSKQRQGDRRTTIYKIKEIQGQNSYSLFSIIFLAGFRTFFFWCSCWYLGGVWGYFGGVLEGSGDVKYGQTMGTELQKFAEPNGVSDLGPNYYYLLTSKLLNQFIYYPYYPYYTRSIA